MRLKWLFIVFFLSSCASDNYQIFSGVSWHDEKGDSPEIIGLTNPLGNIRVETTNDRNVRFYCQHTSSFSESEIGNGLNMCGAELRIQ